MLALLLCWQLMLCWVMTPQAPTPRKEPNTTTWPNAQAKTAATQSKLLLLLLLGRVFAPRSYPGGGEIIAARQFRVQSAEGGKICTKKAIRGAFGAFFHHKYKKTVPASSSERVFLAALVLCIRATSGRGDHAPTQFILPKEAKSAQRRGHQRHIFYRRKKKTAPASSFERVVERAFLATRLIERTKI
jgi:hypothetical protein